MNEIRKEDWGTEAWNEAHFPQDQLDTDGDTWGFRWRGREIWRHKVYLKLLKNMLQKEQPQTVLDIGCALCDFTHKAWMLNNSNKFFGMDISPTAIEWSKKQFPQFDLRSGAIPALPFEESFDIVLCQEVLCYLDADDRKACLQNIREKLKPGGILMLSGVLDGGEFHHSTPEMLGLVKDGFEVNKVVYNHWSTYCRVIEDPLDRIQLRFDSISKWVEFSDEEFQIWSDENEGSLKTKIAKALRAVAPLSKALVKAGSAATRFLAGRTSPVSMFHAIATLRRENEEADEIVVFATKI